MYSDPLLHTALQNVGTPNNAFDIAYHMYWPNGADPFYLANTADNLARKNYYNITGTPTFKVDGSTIGWPGVEGAIQARMIVPSPLWLDLTASVNGNSVTVTTSAVANTNIQDSYVIHIMVLDRYEYLPNSPNGQPDHYHSMRQIVPTSSGQAFSATPNDTVHHTATFTINASWGTQNDLDIACFVQNNSTQEVLQSHSEALPTYYPGLSLTVTPVNPPIIIPANGGSFNYNVTATNAGSSAFSFSAWCLLTLPNGTPYGPLVGPLSLTLPAGGMLTRLRTQNIPGNAPAGQYQFTWNIGAYPNGIWDSDGFPFTKSAAADGGGRIVDWLSSGEEFESNVSSTAPTPAQYSLLQAYPNPFNPTTTISFQLPLLSQVHLAVFDLSGNRVAALVEGYRDAGEHQVTFDASTLASGVYLVRLTAADVQQTTKLLLVK